MKTLNILTTGAFATLLLLGSCTKDVDNPNSPGGGGEGGVVEGIPTYATVSLSQRAGAGTYGSEEYVGGTSEASNAEKMIANAVVLVFNSNNILENCVTLDVETNGEVPNQTTVAKKTFSTTTGKKRLYALANLDDYSEFEAIFNGTDGHTAADKQLSNVCKVIQEIADIKGAATDNKFWMTNVYKLGATIEDQVEVLNVNYETAEGGNGDDPTKNNFKVYIGRMVSKVTPTFAAGIEPASGDGAIDTDGATYRVRNNPTQFYTFPVYEGVQLVSPYYELSFAGATDDNEEEPETYADLTAADFFDNPDYIPMKAPEDDEDANASYLTENSPKVAQRHKVTFLDIKAKWTPNDNAIYLDTNGKVDRTEEKTVKTAIEENQGTFYRIQKWQGGKIVGYCPGIYAQTPEKWTDVGGTPGDAEGSLSEGNTTLYQETERDQAKADKNECYLIVKYDQGMAYWAYWMRSRLDGTIAEKYALKRNNHFKVNIISVDGMGDPNPDDNLDKEEDLEADASMKATIEVLNWNVVDIEGGI